MWTTRRRFLVGAAAALLAFAGSLSFISSPRVAGDTLPAQLSDEAFWNLVNEFSEGGGYFRSDNFVSNETTFQYVIKDLKKTTPGGVYLGVGPDQNFTYIVALQPKMAIIFDIRRQNAMQHLMYKSLIETSADRAEFLSRLFSRKRPQGLSAKSTSEELFAAYDNVEADRLIFEDTLKGIKKDLEETHKFKLSLDDEGNIEYVLRAFFAGGPDLTYNGIGGGNFGRGRMPSYEEIMQTTDAEGTNLSYMGSEENYKSLQNLEKNNLIVPVVGDFAGAKAIRTVAKYLKDHDAHVTAFYLSNVEQYLFQQDDDWSKFYKNVETLPLDSTATFIRSVFNGVAANSQPSGYGLRSASLLSSIPDLLKAFGAGEIQSYYDVINMSK
ncbi:MAG TPA: hypothetical protein VGK48_02790 [Terriglobia bacterium]|jgi:hypothetical protein